MSEYTAVRGMSLAIAGLFRAVFMADPALAATSWFRSLTRTSGQMLMGARLDRR